MKFKETTFERDGKIIFHFDFGGGVSQETDSPAAAEIIRRTNREAGGNPDNCASGCATQIKTDSQERAAKIVEKLMQTPGPQYAPAVRADTVPVKRNADVPDDDSIPGRIDIAEHIKPGHWNELFDASLYAAALGSAPNKDAEIPLLAALYYGRGGRLLKDRLKDEATRKKVYDESLSSDFTNMEMVAQACMSYLASLSAAGFIEELKNEASGLHTVLRIMMRINAEKRNIMLTDAKLRGIQLHQLHIGNAEQVFVGGPKDNQSGDLRSQQKTTLTKIGGAPEASNVSGDDQEQE